MDRTGKELIIKNLEKSGFKFWEIQDQKGQVVATHLEDTGKDGAIDALDEICAILPQGRYIVVLAGQADQENQRVKRTAGGRSSGLINQLYISGEGKAPAINGPDSGAINSQVITQMEKRFQAEKDAFIETSKREELERRLKKLEEGGGGGLAGLLQNESIQQILAGLAAMLIQPKAPINEQANTDHNPQ